jgi:hypothetical protein
VFLNVAAAAEALEASIRREFGIGFSPAVPFTFFEKRGTEVLYIPGGCRLRAG